MKPSAILIVLSICLQGCFVARREYSPPTDLQNHNLRGPVESVKSRHMSIDGDDPDDPGRDSRFDMVIVTVYNKDGNVTMEETYTGGGEKPAKRDIYIYDAAGRLAASEYHDLSSEEVKWSRINYNYDGKGRLESYRALGDTWETRIEYGKGNFPARSVTTMADTSGMVVRYEYDRRGRLVKEGSGSAEIRNRYKGNVLRESIRKYYREYYNDNGDMIRTVNIIIDDTEGGKTREGIIDAVYRYDERGNWIRRELYMEEELFAVWLRDIKYRGDE